MRVFIAVIVLIFSLQSISKADQKNDLINKADNGDAISQNNLGLDHKMECSVIEENSFRLILISPLGQRTAVE